ncbi:hypothetical protein CLF_100137 [Clonorchis sinensis]|uniref:Uncharacterized protein n=1 Tax=Clonorchis sinensis TaxID=79923 RepID=G7Y2R9_CLOSI|nr:hypothetical protein CLF_100137 [Clonorchis sinensis]
MDVDAAKQWSLDWHLSLNDEKCVHISFEGDSANSYVMHGEKGPEDIMRIDAKKDLGIWLFSNMSALHLEKSTQKASAVLRLIRRTFSRITHMDFQILYGAYVRLLFEYATPVVYSGRTKDVILNERVQRAATKMVAGSANCTFCKAEFHPDPALLLAIGCCYGRKSYPTQDWPEIKDACRSGIKPGSDWSKVRSQHPIMTQYWPNVGCQCCIQNASEFPESYCRLRYIYEALYKCSRLRLGR